MSGLDMLKKATHSKKYKKMSVGEASASVQGQQRETKPQQMMRPQTQKFKKGIKSKKKGKKMMAKMCRKHKKMMCKECRA